MYKKVLFTTVLLALILAACSTTAAPTATSAPATEAAATVVSTPAVTLPPQATPTKLVANVGDPMPGCKVEEPLSILPAVKDTDRADGPATAPVTIIEYSDFQCPYCAKIEPVLTQLKQTYSDNLRLIFRYLPLDGHDKSKQAAHAAEAAGQQGNDKFWAMYTVLFQQQSTWAGFTADQFDSWVADQAKSLGLDTAKFATDYKSDAVAARVNQDYTEATVMGVPGTPFLFINGQPYQGSTDYDSLVQILELEKKKFTSCPTMVIDTNKSYTATIKTEKGDIVLDLLADKAPLAVNSFVFLAQNGWFNGITFHRVIPGFVAQSGDPSGTGIGSPGYTFINEINPDLNYDKPGVVGMANAGADTNGSQFFILFAPEEKLNGGYTVFGQVTQGLDVAQKLTTRIPENGGDLPTGDKIISVTITEK